MAWIAVGAAVVGGVAGGVGASGANSAADKAAALNNAPYQNVVGQGTSLMNQPYTPYTGELVAPESGNEIAAGQIAGGLQASEAPNLSKAGQSWNTQTMNEYMNPYIQGALNPALAREKLTFGEQSAGLARKQGMTDSFGVGRSAAQQGELQSQYDIQAGTTEAQGLAAGYGAAQGAFQADTSRYAKLASEQGALGTQAANDLQTTGMNQRSIAQARDSANYNQFQTQQDWGLKRFEATAGAITGAASHEVIPKHTSVLSGVLGGAMSGAGMVMGMGGMGGMMGGGSTGSAGVDTNPTSAADSSNFGSYSGSNSAADTAIFGGGGP